MLDISELNDGEDLTLADSQVMKAGNVASVQLGSLEYAPDFGVDLKYFIDSDFIFQNESFRSYIAQRITESNIDVTQIITSLESFIQKNTFSIGSVNESEGGLIL